MQKTEAPIFAHGASCLEMDRATISQTPLFYANNLCVKNSEGSVYIHVHVELKWWYRTIVSTNGGQ